MIKNLLALSICWFCLPAFYPCIAHAQQHNTKTFTITNDTQLHFIENTGQITDQYGKERSDIQYKVATPGMILFIGNGQLHYQWSKPAKDVQQSDKLLTQPATTHTNLYRMDVLLAGANKHARIVPGQQQGYHEDYPGLHATAQSVNKITYKNVYPNIDWVLYIKDNKVEYDFVVHEGGHVQDIQLQYRGATKLEKTILGNINATTLMGSVTELKPYSYEQDGKNTVATAFKIKKDIITFDVAPYTGTLVIDPTLAWATYYGGAGAEQGYGVACDSAGNVFFAGSTTSTGNIATTGSYQNVLHATYSYTGFLAKFNAAGNRLWGTYYGAAPASGDTTYNYANAVACDRQGNVYITGYTRDTNIITTIGAYQRANNGNVDCYLAKFDGSGTLQWATYYGGSGQEQVFGITCDRNNNVFIAGSTSSSSGIAITGSAQNSLAGGADAFIAKFSSSGTLQWATYCGGSNDDQANGIACDTAGYIYIAGQTTGSFPTTTGCHQSTYGGNTDAFIARYNNAGVRQWSTYYGGGSEDIANGIACNGTGEV